MIQRAEIGWLSNRRILEAEPKATGSVGGSKARDGGKLRTNTLGCGIQSAYISLTLCR